MRKILLFLLVAGSITLLPLVRAEERGVVVEGPAARLPDSKGNWAVLVGIGEFEDEAISDLRWTVNDARELHNVLTTEIGYVPQGQAFLHIAENKAQSVSREDVLTSIRTAAEAMPSDGGCLFLYFTTHGFMEDEKSYLVMSDTHLASKVKTSISVEDIEEVCKGRRKVLFIDACRNEVRTPRAVNTREEARAWDPSTVHSAFKQSLGKLPSALHYSVFSCSEKQTSLEVESLKHGLFTFYLLDALRGGLEGDEDCRLSVGIIASHIQEAIEKNDQKPFVAGNLVEYLPGPCRAITIETNSIRMRRVQGGGFLMGTPPDKIEKMKKALEDCHQCPSCRKSLSTKGLDFSSGTQQITVRDFYVSEDLISNDMFQSFIADSKRSRSGSGGKAVYVSWNDVQDFLNELNSHPDAGGSILGRPPLRLLTEEEWEYIARQKEEKNKDGLRKVKLPSPNCREWTGSVLTEGIGPATRQFFANDNGTRRPVYVIRGWATEYDDVERARHIKGDPKCEVDLDPYHQIGLRRGGIDMNFDEVTGFRIAQDIR